MDEVNLVAPQTRSTCAPTNQIIVILIRPEEISTFGSKYQSNVPHVIASSLAFIFTVPSDLSPICLFSLGEYFSSRLFMYVSHLAVHVRISD